MKNKLLALALAGCAAVPALAAPDVNVSIGINQPGVYGRVNIGNLPPPPLVYPQPVLIAPPRLAEQRQPIYLYAPPGHQKKWAKHCARYNACGHPVYFVQERWVEERWQERRGRAENDRVRGNQGRPDNAHRHDGSRGRDDDRDDRGGHGRGRGRGHGRDH